MRVQQAAWERGGTDYSDEIGRDVLSWCLALTVTALLAAWIVPLWPGNPLAQLFQRDDLPSGIAALQRGMERPRTPDQARVGVSILPAVPLGVSLEHGPPDQVALRVRVAQPLPEGPAPRYWRVRLLNIYTGAGWASDAQVSAAPATAFGDELPPELVVQEVEDERADRTLIAGLADVVGVSRPASAERLADGSLAALVADPPASSYRVLSRLMEYAPPRPVDRAPPDMRIYLGAPSSATPRVRDLASIVSGSDPRIPPMERALLIERYLRELPYAYEVQPLPRGGDAVDQFLFEMRQGYCTYYASAMAVMARSIGIPARVAVGYATGAYDAATGAYVIREAEAHAWPELYIGDRWVIFEPTPVRPLPARSATGQPVAEAAPATETEQQAQDRVTGPLIWAGVLALVALATAAGLLVGRPRRAAPPVTQAQLALERFGARAGVAWPVGATLHEYGALLAPHADGASEALEDVVALVERARYAGRRLDQEEERRLLAASERLGRDMRAAAR
jgi:transglutaminase-like putative cysteine protease